MNDMHTPGPWRRGHMGDCENAWIGPDYDQPLVAKVDRNDREEWEANARLIAAAPDLLALVIQYRDDLRRPPSLESVGRRLNAINETLAKVQS